MKIWKIISLLVALVIVFPLVFLGVFGVDINSHRTEVADALSKNLGREVKLDGQLKFGLSLTDGFNLSIGDASIANPAWASRPLLAKAGKLELSVGIMPLLKRQLSVNAFTLSDADIKLESNAQGVSNLEMAGAGAQAKIDAPKENAQPAAAASASPISIHVSRLNIDNSRLIIRSKDGKLSEYAIKSMALKSKAVGIELDFKGEISGAPVTVSLSGDDLSGILNSLWKFKAEVLYGNYNLTAEGVLNNASSEVDISSYQLKSGKTVVSGNMDVKYGSRPSIKGKVESDHLDIADLKPKEEAAAKADKAAPAAKSSKRAFSDDPIDLSGMKAVDADINVLIKEMIVGSMPVQKLSTRIVLTGGQLLVSPLSMMVADKEVKGQAKVDASGAKPQISLIANAHQLDLSQFIKTWGIESFIKGKADFDLDISAVGNSQHELASNSNGQINLIMASGEVNPGILRGLAGGVLDAIIPGAGVLTQSSLNCLVARFKIVNGALKTNGVLLDTSAATVSAYGGVSLGSEIINMRVLTNSKGVGVASLIPSVAIGGSLMEPSFTPEAGAVAKKLAGSLIEGEIGSILGGGLLDSGDGVPEVVSVAGQNACMYTLDHPTAAKSKPAAQTPTGKTGIVNDIAGKAGGLMKGLGGGLFGK